MRSRFWAVTVLLGIASALISGCSQSAAVNNNGAFVTPGDVRQVVFNQGWLFSPGDISGAEASDFNDDSWRKLDLPHDWSIEGQFDTKWASGTGFLPAGVGWYRKHFSLPFGDSGKTITIRFDGVYKNSTVYLNGHKLGDRPYGFISFEYDLTPFINIAHENVLAVRVDHHDFADSRWYPGSGIYRNVYLTATDPIHVDRYGTFVTTDKVSEKSAEVNIRTTVRNDAPAGDGEAVIRVVTTIYDDAGNAVGSNVSDQVVSASESATMPQRFQVDQPALWSVDHPTLYTALTQVLQDDKTVDSYRTPFGIRSIRFDSGSGFWLNGQSMKLKGVCLHEDAGALGSAVPPQVWERRLRILKEAGTNAIRCSHNPPSPDFLDLCDRLGFLVMDEAFDEWTAPKRKWMDKWNGEKFSTDGYHSDFARWADHDIQDMVRRDRNHPSIVLWSIGNEIDYPNDPYPKNDPELIPIAQRLMKDVKELDTSRPVTAACASIESNLYHTLLDAEGYNYQEARYADDHANRPDRVIFGSENKQDLAAWMAVAQSPYICGQFLWTGIDYMGEAKAFPNRSSGDGFLDLAAFPKLQYYFRKSLWNDSPMVKMAPGPRGGLLCFTNGDSVEFSQNGVSAGEERLPEGRIIQVHADPANGPINAVAKRNGQPIAQDTYMTPGAAALIQMREFKTTLGSGDGPNVAQVELYITDANGTIVPDASNNVVVSVTGNGRIMGIESGDPNSVENYQASNHKAHHGRLLIYLEASGLVQVSAEAAGLPKTTIYAGH